MTVHSGPHVHANGECSWSFDGCGTHLWCSADCAEGSDECAGTDHPHHGPRRIQLRRTKGWRKPAGAIVVSRRSKWGNPYAVKAVDRHGHYPFGWYVHHDPSVAAFGHIYATERAAVERAVELFRRDAERPSWTDRIAELVGHDLACWCPLDQPCHADVLLSLANRPHVNLTRVVPRTGRKTRP